MARVRVVIDGERGTVDEKDLDNLPEGARVLTAQDLANERLDAEWASKSTGQKIAGAAGFLGPIGWGVSAAADGALPPTLDAYREGVASGASAGLYGGLARQATEAVHGRAAGDAYAQHSDDLAEAHGTAKGLGEIVGMAAPALASGGATGAAGAASKAIPAVGLSAAGGAVESAVARQLGGLAAKGALGRAAATAGAMGARGAVEGAAFAAGSEVGDAYLHDTPITGEKLYAAMGHGALIGGSLGGALGLGGSLVGSGARGLTSRLKRGSATTAEIPPPLELPPATRSAEVPFIDPEAGLGQVPKGREVFSIGAERRPVVLRPGGKPGLSAEEPISISSRLGIDPDAGLHAPRGKITEPLFARDLSTADLFTDAAEQRPMRLAGDVFRKDGKLPSTSRPVRQRFDIGLDPDAGLGAAEESREAFRLSSAKKVPRGIDASLADDLSPIESRSPIKIPGVAVEETAAAARPREKGLLGFLANPTSDGAREMAHDQAWRSFGGGFGLQTSRYAKHAARHFPNGTSDLGETALRYGISPVNNEATPLKAAWMAAKEGTPADMLPKAAAAWEGVGKQIGEITDASGAMVTRAQVLTAIDSVAKAYEGTAATRPVGRSIRLFGDELVDSLGLHAEGSTARVQDALRERKGIDRLAFRDAPTLDPKAQLEAKRRLSGAIEDVIEGVMDEASGKVPGELRAQYKTLKGDYHRLSVINEALEDSAARASKGATLGLGEKFAVASAVASGNFGAAPVLAVGGKMLRERGNAAAAAFLTRVADQKSIEAVVQHMNRRMSKAAAGALAEAPKTSARPPTRATQRAAAYTAANAKTERAEQQKKAQKVLKWSADYQTNPTATMEQVQEAAAIVARAAGPKAAESYTAAAMKAIAFIAAHVPIKERRDPLDPRSTPPLTDDEAARLIRAAKYGLEPSKVFEDFGKGIITPEGLRAAKQLAPESFAEFQLELQERVEGMMLRNARLSQDQRLRLDKLLGYPAGADLKPKSIARRQQNYADPLPVEEPPMNGPDGPPPAGPSGNPPLDMNIQQSGFDAIESRMAG